MPKKAHPSRASALPVMISQRAARTRSVPGLYGVVNADVAHHAGFNYSNAMKGKKGKWTFEALDKFLENPSKSVPGTSMTFLGIRRATDRAAVIVYLNTLADSPAPLPKPVAATPPAEKKDEPVKQ